MKETLVETALNAADGLGCLLLTHKKSAHGFCSRYLAAPSAEERLSVTYLCPTVAAHTTMRQTMPTYTFKLLDDGGGLTDDTGIRLPNSKAAYGYACDVAHEMMDHREAATRSWRLDVYENGAKKLFGILFATVDETLNHLKPDNRKLVEITALRRRSLHDAFHAAWMTCRESQTLVARSHGKLYLAADRGQKTIRD